VIFSYDTFHALLPTNDTMILLIVVYYLQDGGGFLQDNLLENLRKIGYLGPAGTFTQQAARVLFPESALLPISDIYNIFYAVSCKTCDVGIVPIENSTEGPVNATLDALLKTENLVITGSVILPISHTLMGSDNITTNAEVEKILAHPQALAQCREYIRCNYPMALLMPCASNGEAAAKVASASGEAWAAIGPAAAAKEYGLRIWAEDIQDSFLNSTSFIQIEHKKEGEAVIPSAGCCTSIAFSTKNSPGALYRMLGIFENYSINMTKILSRPMPERPGEYIFFTDIEGYQPEKAKKALKQIEDEATMYRFLGSYSVIKKKG